MHHDLIADILLLCPPQVELKDLKQVAVLGAGAFGQVTLVKHEGRYYALKTLAKMHIVQSGLTVRCSTTGPQPRTLGRLPFPMVPTM